MKIEQLIREKVSFLSAGQKKVAEYILQHLDSFSYSVSFLSISRYFSYENIFVRPLLGFSTRIPKSISFLAALETVL